jgi:peptidoglycan/LPS O-acetylase OafA/YrhL
MSDNRPKLEWIQSLRGVAVILVVLTHARYFFLNTPLWGMAEQVMLPGAMGVDLFFVISGFIMVYTTRDSDGSLRYAGDFMLKRFARIWPAYAVITLIWLCVNYDGFGFLSDRGLVRNLLLSLSFVPANPASPLYFNVSLPLGWTLDFEMYFYVIFAVSLLFKRLRWLALGGWILATVLLLPSVKRELTLDVMTNFNFSFGYLNLVTNPIVLEFLAGALIGWLYTQPWFSIKSASICRHLVFLVLAGTGWYLLSGLGNFHGPRQWGAAMALMVFGLALAGKTVQLAPPRVLVWLGTISYSLYLTHTTTQLLVTRYVERVGGYTHGWGHVFLTTAIAITVAAISHHYLEERLSRIVRAALMGTAHSARRRLMPVRAG